MKKHLAINPDYQKIQIDEIDKVITQLKEGGTTEEDTNKIRERLYKSLKNERLDLSNLKISDEILNQILPLLSVLNITILNLNSNDIGPEGAKALAKALIENTSLKTLNLNSNDIGPEGAKALAEALENKQITEELLIFALTTSDLTEL